MRLARVGPRGHERPVVVTDDGRLVDVSAHVSDFDRSFFAEFEAGRLAELAAAPDAKVIDDAHVRYGSPLARPGKIVCIGLNYIDHAVEAEMEIPAEPLTFLKSPDSVCGPHDDLLLPVGGDKVDWEVELGVVIGRRARYLRDEQDALACIAGLCVSNDVSERSFQLEHGGQWSKGKSCETFNPLGPWLQVFEPGQDLDSLGLELAVNGEVRQRATTKDLIFGVAEVIRYLSQFMVLEPGDLVNTGTPPGTAMGLPDQPYLRVGDVVEATIDGLGRQRQRCVRAEI